MVRHRGARYSAHRHRHRGAHSQTKLSWRSPVQHMQYDASEYQSSWGHTVVPTPTPSPRMRRPMIIMEMCTAPAMMAAPTMKVHPEKMMGTCTEYTRISITASLHQATANPLWTSLCFYMLADSFVGLNPATMGAPPLMKVHPEKTPEACTECRKFATASCKGSR